MTFSLTAAVYSSIELMTYGHLHNYVTCVPILHLSDIWNQGLSIFLCVDLECETYCLRRFLVKPKTLHKRGVADLANFVFEDDQSSGTFNQCAQDPN